MDAKEKAEDKIEPVLAKLTTEEVDRLAPDGGEFKQVAEAIMAWYTLLFASRIFKRSAKVQSVLSSSLVVLGTLVKYAYALGRRRGQRDCQLKSACGMVGRVSVGAKVVSATPTIQTADDRGAGHA
jgi:hypothetical protein